MQKRVSGCSAVGSALALGARCRRFKSCHSDQQKAKERFILSFAFLVDVTTQGCLRSKCRFVCHGEARRARLSGEWCEHHGAMRHYYVAPTTNKKESRCGSLFYITFFLRLSLNVDSLARNFVAFIPCFTET